MLNDKLILVQKLRINKILLTDYMEAQEQGRPMCVCLGFSEKGNKILTGAIKETKFETETEEKATQRLPYLVIHPINSHQTRTLLRIARSACQKGL